MSEHDLPPERSHRADPSGLGPEVEAVDRSDATTSRRRQEGCSRPC